MDEVRKSIFDNLSQIQTFPFEEKKGNLTYLSWANAWGLVKKAEPDAAFTVVTFDANGIRTEGGCHTREPISASYLDSQYQGDPRATCQ